VLWIVPRRLGIWKKPPGAAVVLSLFEWWTDEDETLTYSYTGLLARRPGG
jgi:hypothetical protein